MYIFNTRYFVNIRTQLEPTQKHHAFKTESEYEVKTVLNDTNLNLKL